MTYPQTQVRKVKQTFSLIYYSHIHLVLMGMIIAAATNYVLTGNVTWQAVLLIGMATYVTYTIDNLFDWQKDRPNYVEAESIIRKYHLFSIIPLTLCTAGIIWIVAASDTAFIMGIALLMAAVGFSITRLPVFRRTDPSLTVGIIHFILNRVFISLVWSVVCVFLPLFYAGDVIDHRVWSSLFYIWNLVFIYAVIWKLEKAPLYLRRIFNSSSLGIYLQMLCVNAILIPIDNWLTGKSGFIGVINILPPLAFFLMLEKFRLDWTQTRGHLIRIALILAAVTAFILAIQFLNT